MPLAAADWTGFRGPDHSGVSTEKGLLKTWPEGGPKLVWKTDKAGLGYAGMAVVKGVVYTMGARENQEYAIALDDKGNEKWATLLGPVHDWSANQSDLFIAAGASFSGVEANLAFNVLTGAGTLTSGLDNSRIFLGAANGNGTFAGTIADNTAGSSFPATLVKLGTGTAGSVKAWQKISGVWTLILSLDDVATLSDPAYVSTEFLLNTYFNGNSPQTQSDYVDRIVIEKDLSKLTQTDAAGNKIIGESI